MRRIWDFISYPSHSRTIGFLAFLVVLLAIPLTVNIAQKQQELRQRAAFNNEGGGGGSGSTECDQNGGYCDNGQCAKFVPHCLVDDTLPSNCINKGADCTSPDGQTSHVYQCSELQPWSCSIPTPVPSSGTCTYSCLWQDIQRCEQAEGTGNCAIVPGQTCGNGNSCIQITAGGLSACDKAKGQCVDQGYWQQHQSEGSIISKSCYAGDLVCFKKNASVPDCLATSGQNCDYKDISACTSKGNNCSRGVGACSNGNSCLVVTGSLGGGGGTTCDASKGYVGTCSNNGATQNNPSSCTRADGSQGYSVEQCQGSCWYDSYYDSRKQPASQWCYAKGGIPTGYPLPGCDPQKVKCGTDEIANKMANGNWICLNTKTGNITSTVPICAKGAQITFVVGLDGIGQTGDQQAPDKWQPTKSAKGSNQDPRNKQRTFYYQVFDSTGTTLQVEGQGTIDFDSASGKFKAGATLNKPLSDGTYIMKVRAMGFLTKKIGVTISGGVAQVQALNLANGDTNGNNQLDITDYNLILSCAFKPMTTSCQPADLDDNGVVDQFDYNLFLREYLNPALQAKRENGD